MWQAPPSGGGGAGFTSQRTQYYPSGLPREDSEGQEVQNKKYNGKEFIEAHGLDEYDSQARMYYPAIMRTTTIDPLAEEYYSISPYAWCGNNPVNRIDPDGRQPVIPYPVYYYPAYTANPYIAQRANMRLSSPSANEVRKAIKTNAIVAASILATQVKQSINALTSVFSETNEATTKNAKKPQDTRQGKKEQDRRGKRSQQEDTDIAKKHNKSIDRNGNTGTPDGTPDPKRGLNEAGVIVVGFTSVGLVGAAYKEIRQLPTGSSDEVIQPIPVPKLPKPEPTKIEPPKINPINP